MSLLLNMLSRLVITFLPRSKRLLISWLQSPSAVILEPPKIKSATVSTVFSSIYDLGSAKQIPLCKMRKAVVSTKWRDWILCQVQGNLCFFECSGQGSYVFNAQEWAASDRVCREILHKEIPCNSEVFLLAALFLLAQHRNFFAK